jgi:CheY-like chemotaxis protein
MAIQILVVDDDADLRDLLRNYLGGAGLEVSVLHDAASLERRLERERPDLIVLDLMMSDIDGLTALRKLRATGDDLPVIILTAKADEVDRIIGLELGADGSASRIRRRRHTSPASRQCCGAARRRRRPRRNTASRSASAASCSISSRAP